MKLYCYLFGHNEDITCTDSGYYICKRCGKHQFYDESYNKQAKLLIPYWKLKYYFYDFKIWVEYKLFKSNKLPF